MNRSSHVAILAFPFGSHAAPLLNNAQRLAASAPPGVILSFFNTASSNAKIFSGSQKSAENLRIYNVWDGVADDDDDAVASPKSPLEAIELFIKATPDNFKKRVQEAEAETGLKVSCLLTDAFLWFSGEMAEEMGVPWVAFWTAGPTFLSVHLHTDLIRSTILTSGTNVINAESNLKFLPGLSAIRISDLPEEVVSGNLESPFAEMLHNMGLNLAKATAVVLNSFQELEPTVTNHLKSILRNVLCIGPSTIIVPLLSKSDDDQSGCLTWLEHQKFASVIYIGFGTVLVPPPNELAELAVALEASKIPFLWSLRDTAKDQLPKEFLEKTRKFGKIVPWAPQLSVLVHFSIGVYVTHGGYNSVMESILAKVPVICRPLHGDNMINCRLMEELWEIGVKVEGGRFSKKGMMNALDMIMVSEKGHIMRDNVGKLRGHMLGSVGPNGSSAQNFKGFSDLLICN